jgi:hypothetical protein
MIQLDGVFLDDYNKAREILANNNDDGDVEWAEETITAYKEARQEKHEAEREKDKYLHGYRTCDICRERQNVPRTDACCCEACWDEYLDCLDNEWV